MPLSAELAAEMNATFGELMRRAQESGDLRPDVVLDDIPMFMCGIGVATAQAAPLPGRLAPPPGDRDRRPARLERLRRPLPLLESVGHDRPGDRQRSRSAGGRVGPLPPAGRRRGRSPGRRRRAARRRPDARRRVRRAATPASSPSSTAPGLVAAMKELGEIEEIAGRAGTYAHLVVLDRHRRRPRYGALLQRVEEKGTAIETALLFFHLEWAALDDARAEELLATDGLDFARHHLATARRYRPHLLSEPEERILTEKAVSGRSAWVRLFEEQTAAITGRAARRRRAGRRWRSRSRGCSTPDREVRRDTAERVTAGAAARPAHARVHVQHAARGQDDRRPAAGLPALAGVAQPVQRGLRRVRAGADRGRPRRATSCRAAGTG